MCRKGQFACYEFLRTTKSVEQTYLEVLCVQRILNIRRLRIPKKCQAGPGKSTALSDRVRSTAPECSKFGACYMMDPRLDHLHPVPRCNTNCLSKCIVMINSRNINRSNDAETIDLSARYSQQCCARIMGSCCHFELGSQLSDRTIILYRCCQRRSLRLVISFNGNVSADFTKLRMQRKLRVIVQDCIFPAGHLGNETVSWAGDRSA